MEEAEQNGGSEVKTEDLSVQDRWHTEGCIKEVSVKDKTIEVKLSPSDEFLFGPDEFVVQSRENLKPPKKSGTGESTTTEEPSSDSNGSATPGCKKIVLSNETGSEARLVGLNTMFQVKVSGKVDDHRIDLATLYALKKDRAKVRVVVEIVGSDYSIKELAFI